MRLKLLRPLGVSSLLVLTGCTTQEKPSLQIPWTVHVATERGEDLAGVEVFFDENHVGTTGIDGRLTRMIAGAYGDPTHVTHRCPLGYGSEDGPTIVRLRRYRPSDTPAAMEVALTCRRQMRTAAFVIRTVGAPRVPVSLNGEVIGETSLAGVTQFSRAGAPGTEYLVEIDASAARGIRPTHTSHRFVLGDDDALFVVDQTFERLRKRRHPRSRPRPIIKIE